MDTTSHGSVEPKKPDENSHQKTTETMERPWSDWILALEDLLDKSRKIPESLLPVDLKAGKVKDDRKSPGHVGGSNDHSIQASDGGSGNSLCQIDKAVEDEWIKAIDEGDCMELMKQLGKNPCLLAIWRNRTVLHVAARQGCLKLILHILSLFLVEDDKWRGCYRAFLHHGKSIDLNDFFKECDKFQLTAADRLWFAMGNSSMYQIFYLTVPYGYCLPDALPTVASMQDEVLNCHFQDESMEYRLFNDDCYNMNTPLISTDKPHYRVFLLEALSRHKELLDANLELVEDWDYNFVAEYQELQFHLACERIWRSDCKAYVKAVIEDCVQEGPVVVKYLFQMRNAQGQTPLHPHRDTDDVKRLLGLIPEGEEYKDCLNVRDGRGWTVLHEATAYGYSENLEALLKDGRVDVNARVRNVEDSQIGDGAAPLPFISLSYMVTCLSSAGF